MGYVSASDFAYQSRRLWARYLCKSQDGNVRWLDRTLLMPTTDMGGVLPDRIAPHVFQEIYASGKNPDGNYWKEFDDSGARFNLFERVCERVPASRPWLLKEFRVYQREDPPPIAHSRAYLSSFLAERELMFLPARAVRALQQLRPRLYPYLKKCAVQDLVEAATPETLLFLMAFLHEIVWWAKGRPTEDIVKIAEDAVSQFCESLTKRGFEDASEIAEAIKLPMYGAVVSIKYWGDRSPPAGYTRTFYNFPPVPLLIKDTPEIRDACECVHAAGEDIHEFVDQPLPSRYEALPGLDWAPTTASVKAATRALVSGILSTHKEISAEYERDLLCSLPITNSYSPTARRQQKNTDRRHSSPTRSQVRR